MTVSRFVILGFGSALIAACGLNGVQPPLAAADAAAVIDMGLISYDPPAVTIRAGQTVMWRNASIISHTVTSTGSAASGAAAFYSSDVRPGSFYRHRFDVAGTYPYICTHHGAVGMVGTVTVIR